MCIGVMYDRLHSRNIADYGGVVNVMPKFAAFMMLFSMAIAGSPLTSGFVGEFMVVSAKAIDSVNTIVNDNGYLKAYNTDYIAIAKLIEKYRWDRRRR